MASNAASVIRSVWTSRWCSAGVLTIRIRRSRSEAGVKVVSGRRSRRLSIRPRLTPRSSTPTEPPRRPWSSIAATTASMTLPAGTSAAMRGLVGVQLDALGRIAEERAPRERAANRRVRRQGKVCLAHRGDDRPGADVVCGHDDVGLTHVGENLVGDVPDAAEVERVLERRRDQPVEAFGGEELAGPLGVDQGRCRRLGLLGGDAHVLSPWASAWTGSATSRW